MPQGKIWIGLIALILCACQPQVKDGVLPTLFVLQTATPVSAQPLEFWQPVTGQLAPDIIDVWEFEGNSGDKITLRALGRGASATLTLLDSRQQLLAQGATIETELPSTGQFFVQVKSGGNGEYELGLAYTDQPNPADTLPTSIPQVVGVPTPIPAYADLGSFIGELVHGETVSGTFSQNSTEHVYTFEGVGGRYITVQVNRVTGDIDPLITLYDPEGVPLAVDGGSGLNNDALLRNIQLTQDGFYTLQTASEASGGYTLTFYDNAEFSPVTPTVFITPSETPVIPVLTPTLATMISGAELEDHVPVNGELTKQGDVAVYAFETIANEISTIGVIPIEDSALIPRIEVIDPEGVPVAAISGNNSPNNREALLSPFVPAMAGTYTVFVTGEGNTFGKYRVSYGVGTSRQTVMRGEASAGEIHLGAITPGGMRDVWHTYLQKDDVITATLNTQQGALNPVLEVISHDGALVGIDNNSGGERTPLINGIRIPENGLYYFRIRPAVPGSIGPYALIWRYVSVGPTATPPEGTVPVLTVEDTVAENAYEFYPFQGRSGQKIRVRVTAATNTTLDPVLALLDMNGQIIGEADDFNGDLNPRLEITLPSDGTYTIRVNGYLSSGGFKVVVEEVF